MYHEPLATPPFFGFEPAVISTCGGFSRREWLALSGGLIGVRKASRFWGGLNQDAIIGRTEFLGVAASNIFCHAMLKKAVLSVELGLTAS